MGPPSSTSPDKPVGSSADPAGHGLRTGVVWAGRRRPSLGDSISVTLPGDMSRGPCLYQNAHSGRTRARFELTPASPPKPK